MPMPWEQDYGGATQAPDAVKAMPWEKDYGEAKDAAPKETLLEHVGKWPGRIADTIRGAVTLPRDVYQGKVDPFSPEGRERASDLTGLIAPGAEVAGLGKQMARRAFEPGAPNPEFKAPLTPGLQAAQTAADLGSPLPTGLTSGNRATQALTQASRSMPLVGAEIDKRVAGTVDAAGNAVKDIAEGLSGGVPDRATAGANLRPSLQGVIADNNDRIDRVYGALRHVIDPDAKSPLSNTLNALKGILQSRIDAGMKKPEAGLTDIINLTNKGGSFNGLQRARADVGKIIGLAESNPNPGFNVGDFKRIYAAMTGDMANTVRANARPGVSPAMAHGAWRTAEDAAVQLVERNKNVQKLLHPGMSNESMVGSVINSAQDRSGDARLLAQLRSQMPKQDFEQIVGVGLSEMGHNPATGEFSLQKFGTSWRKLGDTAKSVLFPDPAHREALENIAGLDKVLKASDQYLNKSQTGRVDTLTKVIGGGGAVAGALATGNIPAVFGALAAGAGGFGLAKYLARPATASAIAKWVKAAQNAPRSPGPGQQWALRLAGRNLLNNLPEGEAGASGADRPARPQSPVALPVSAARREPLRVTAHPRKAQDRAPSSP